MKLSSPARELVTLIRRHRLNYDTFRAAAHAARRHLNLRPPSRGRRLPRLLPTSSLQKYFAAIDATDNLQHQIMLRLLLFTGLRVSELTGIRVADVDLVAGKIFIEQGKGDKDRYVLFPDAFRLTLRTYMAGNPDNEYLFESRQKKRYSVRRIEQIVEEYAHAAGIEERVHPHLFRHINLTHLTKSGVTDAQIQLVSGHASKKSLERYQHMSLGDVKEDYERAMKELEIK